MVVEFNLNLGRLLINQFIYQYCILIILFFAAFQQLIETFKTKCNSNELPNTIKFFDEYFTNQQNITFEDFNGVLTFAHSLEWRVNIPFWCLSKSFTAVKDAWFVDELTNLHDELELFLENNVVSYLQFKFLLYFLNHFLTLLF